MNERTAPTSTHHGRERARADATRHIPRAGEVLFDRFKVLRSLGEGGGGRVYLVEEMATGRQVALKALRAVAEISRFKSEFRIHRSFSHPFVLTPDELLVSPTLAAITMPYIEDARPLDQALREIPKSDRNDALIKLFGQLARAVAALHRQGLLHGDLKPDNTLVDQSGLLRLIDFGTVGDVGKQVGKLRGTPSYIAPERIQGGAPDEASDWYSFGVMLYEAIVGRLPFSGSSDVVLEAKLNQPAPPIECQGELAALSSLTNCLLEVDARHRPRVVEILAKLGVKRSEELRPQFVGRRTELQSLKGELEATKKSGCRIVNLRGESGVGKTALVAEFRKHLEREDVPVTWLSGDCSEYELVAYNVLDEALAHLLACVHDQAIDLSVLDPGALWALCRLFGDSTRDFIARSRVVRNLIEGDTPGDANALLRDPIALKGRALYALGQLMEALCDCQPVILALDQLQWADADSATLVAYLCSRLRAAPLLVLQICRQDGVAASAYLQAMHAQRPHVPSVQFELAGLSAAEANALREQLPREAREAAESTNNPQLIIHAQAPHAMSTRYASDQLRTAQFLAVAAQPMSEQVVRRVLGEEAVAPGVLRVLEHGSLIRRGSAQPNQDFLPVHDHTLKALRKTLSAEEERQIHLAVAEGLQHETPPPHESIARHFESGGQIQEALPHYLRAADRSRHLLAFEAEAGWLTRALKPLAARASEHREVSLRLAQAWGRAGFGKNAASEYLKLASSAEPSKARRLRLRAVQQFFRAGAREEGFAVLQQLMKETRLRNPATTVGALAGLMAQRTLLRWGGTQLTTDEPGPRCASEVDRVDVAAAAKNGFMPMDFVRGAYFAALSLRLAIRAGEPSRVAIAISDEILFLANEGLGASERIAPLLSQARELATRSKDTHALAYVDVADGGASLLMGNFVDAQNKLGAAELALRQSHPELTWELTACRMYYITACQFGGALSKVESCLDSWIEVARRRDDDAALGYFLPERVFTLIAADKLNDARSAYEEALSVTNGDDQAQAMLVHQRYYLSVYEGAATGRLEEMRDEFRKIYRSLLNFSQGIRGMSRFLDASADLCIMAREGVTSRRLRRIEGNRKRLLKEQVDWTSGLAAVIEAASHYAQGRTTEAMSRLELATRTLMPQMPLFAHAAAFRSAQLRGDPTGGPARGLLLEQGVGKPRAFVEMLVTGYTKSASRIDG